jgi:hypothetical protein
MMPLMIELMLGDTIFTMILTGAKLLLNLIIAEGEMMAITWVEPLLILLLLFALPPPKEPPDRRKYVTKATRQANQSQWHRLYQRALTMLAPPTSVTRLGCQELSKNEPRTATRSPGKERKSATRINRSLARSMGLLMVTCMSAASLQGTTAFDLDSKQIATENCSSRCLTVSRRDFVPGTLSKCNVLVSGVGGTIKCELQGTVKWTIQDDQGRAHDLLVPDTPMCEALPHRLLSPQHWAQETEKGSRIPFLHGERPGCNICAVATILTWGRGKFVKTVMTKPGIRRYTAFATKVVSLELKICCFVATCPPQPSVTDVADDQESVESTINHEPDSDKSTGDDQTTSNKTLMTDDDQTTSDATSVTSTPTSGMTSQDSKKGMRKINFQTESDIPGLSVEQDHPLKVDQDELYRLHVRMGHQKQWQDGETYQAGSNIARRPCAPHVNTGKQLEDLGAQRRRTGQ